MMWCVSGWSICSRPPPPTRLERRPARSDSVASRLNHTASIGAAVERAPAVHTGIDELRLQFCESGGVEEGAPQSLSWLLDERASAGRENLDAIHVSRYD